jgi:hypothetical protein
VRRLILYEPPVFEFPRAPRYQEIPESPDHALESGDHEEVVTIFLRDQVGTDDSSLARLKSSPIWDVFKKVADTLPRAARVVNTFRVELNLLSQWRVPTTMLLGGESRRQRHVHLPFDSRLPLCNPGRARAFSDAERGGVLCRQSRRAGARMTGVTPMYNRNFVSASTDRR